MCWSASILRVGGAPRLSANSNGAIRAEQQGEPPTKSVAHTLYTASQAYIAQRNATIIPGAGATADRYEKTLVAEGFLRDVSSLHDLDADGRLVLKVVGSPCTV